MPTEHEVKVRPEKTAAIKEISTSLQRAPAVLLTEYRGLTVAELAALRSSLQAAEAEYRVVKNTLTLRAATQAGVEGLDDILQGPTAIAYCYGDPVSGAKALSDFASSHPALVIKGGILDGRVMSATDTQALARVDPREVSLGKICGCLTSGLSAIASTLEAPLSRIVYVLLAKGE